MAETLQERQQRFLERDIERKAKEQQLMEGVPALLPKATWMAGLMAPSSGITDTLGLYPKDTSGSGEMLPSFGENIQNKKYLDALYQSLGLAGDVALGAGVFYPPALAIGAGLKTAGGLGKAAKSTKDLMFLHKTSPEKLELYERLGGLPSPSIAVTKQDIPVEYFGDITLVGKPKSFDPRVSATNKIYSADAYTPRGYSPIRTTKKGGFEKYMEDYDDLLSEYKIDGIKYDLVEAQFKKNARPRHVSSAEDFFRGTPGKLKYYQEQGIPIKKVYNPAKNLKEYLKPRLNLAKTLRPVRELVDDTGNYVDDEHFNNWATKQLDKYFDTKEYFRPGGYGTRLQEYNLGNISRAMKKKPQRGGEPGVIRGTYYRKALQSRKFKSLADVKKSKKLLKHPDKLNEDAAKVNSKYNKISNTIKSGPYGGDLSDAMTEATRAGGSKKAIKAAFEKNGFPDLPDKTVDDVYDLFQSQKKLSSDYFEAKPTRPVMFEEFAGAIVPKNIDQKTLDILLRKGLKTVKYDPNIARGDLIARKKFPEQMFNFLLPTTLIGGAARGRIREKEEDK